MDWTSEEGSWLLKFTSAQRAAGRLTQDQVERLENIALGCDELSLRRQSEKNSNSLEKRVDKALQATAEAWLADSYEEMGIDGVITAIWLLSRKTTTSGVMSGITGALGAMLGGGFGGKGGG
jgi:hypothetical protein